jgi:carboxyl-terminal processing protease
MLASAVWAQEGQRVNLVADEVLASSDWKEYTQLLAENFLGPIDTPRLEQHCRNSISPDAVKADVGAIEDCLRGAAESLEFSTTYLSILDTMQLDAQVRRGLVGIGVEVTQRDGFVQIVTPISGGAAERAGLKPGDRILSLDGKPVRGLPLADAVRLMRGEAGTDLRLIVARPDVPAPLNVVVRREEVRVLSVRSSRISPELGYVRISQFLDETRNELIAAVQKLQSVGAGPLKGLVLDLRRCPGGLLEASVDIASLFVPPGSSVLRTTGRKAGVTRVYVASANPNGERKVPRTPEPPDWTLRGMRVVVVIDRHTGGGAEALAALLKEVRGATIVGETSSGFGIVQQLFRLKSGASVRIGTALMSAPSGRVWNGQGVVPDALVTRPDGATWEFGDVQFDTQLGKAVDALRE